MGGGGYVNKPNKTTKFETLNNKSIYKKLALLFVAVFLVASVYFKTSSARYKVTQEVPINSENLNLNNLNTVAVFMQNEEGTYDKVENNLIPTGNYELDLENTKCTVNDAEVEGIEFSYENGKVGVFGITQGKMKCNFYFREKKLPTDVIKDQVVAGAIQPNFANTSCFNGSNDWLGDCGEETNGVYSETTSLGITYYFRGSVNNNWLKFGKMGTDGSGEDIWWRIIRINEDGTVRLIYAGSGAKDTVASSNMIDEVEGYWMNNSNINSELTNVRYNEDDNVYVQNAGVGYMYGTPGSDNFRTEHGYDLIDANRQDELNSSDAKKILDKWYEENLLDENEMLSGSTGFCGDRILADGYENKGYGQEKTYYKANGKLTYPNFQPSYECPNEKYDLYTTKSDSGKGNGVLDYPIGLITANEVSYAGGLWGEENHGYWLYTGRFYWTISPAYYDNEYAYVFNVSVFGGFDSNIVANECDLLPVVNLKPEYFKTQDENGNPLDGTIDKPYIASAT